MVHAPHPVPVCAAHSLPIPCSALAAKGNGPDIGFVVVESRQEIAMLVWVTWIALDIDNCMIFNTQPIPFPLWLHVI